MEVVLLEPPPSEVPWPAEAEPIIFAPTQVDVPLLPMLDISPEELSADQRLQGLYLGQVRARIARAWQEVSPLKPESPVVQCVAVITQGARGDVQNVDFPECTIPAPMRERLAQVIRGASPLPAPPASLPWGAQVRISLEVSP